MQQLAGRLATLDPDASAAVEVIAYFDRLIEAHAGLEAFVRGAAVLSGCPARLRDPGRQVNVRVEPDGRRIDLSTEPAPQWPVLSLESGRPTTTGAAAWLEREQPPGTIDAMVLERLAAGARLVLDRTRGRAAAPDPASVETVLDPNLSPDTRLRAARRLHLARDAVARTVAVRTGTHLPQAARVEGVLALVVDAAVDIPARHYPGQIGIGPATSVLELPGSWRAARIALRFTADGTPSHPGPQLVRADELGGLTELATTVDGASERCADVQALDRAAARWPWALETLDAVTGQTSLRSAATELHLHHSTLSQRLRQIDQHLGWPVGTPDGRLRLHLALVLRRLHEDPG